MNTANSAVTLELRIVESTSLDLVRRHAGIDQRIRTLLTRRSLEPSIATQADGFWFM